jgi:hypothetical protein
VRIIHISFSPDELAESSARWSPGGAPDPSILGLHLFGSPHRQAQKSDAGQLIAIHWIQNDFVYLVVEGIVILLKATFQNPSTYDLKILGVNFPASHKALSSETIVTAKIGFLIFSLWMFRARISKFSSFLNSFGILIVVLWLHVDYLELAK